MAVFSHTLTQTHKTAGREVTADKTYTGDGQQSRQVAVAEDALDLLVNLAIDISKAVLITFKSDQSMLVETNSSSAPTNTFTLLPGVPYIWANDSLFANLITADVTAIYLTNNTATPATVEIEVLEYSTPV